MHVCMGRVLFYRLLFNLSHKIFGFGWFLHYTVSNGNTDAARIVILSSFVAHCIMATYICDAQ